MKTFIRRIYILGLLFILVVGLNLFFGHRNLESQLRREMERSISFKLEHITEQVSFDLARVENTLHAAEVLVKTAKDDDEILQAFRELLRPHDTYLAIFMGFPSTKSIYANDWVPPPDLDVTTRPWYKAAVEEGKLIFTPPYLDIVKDRLVFTMAKPIFSEEGELLGVVGIDKSLQWMLGLLEKEKASEHGHSLFFNKEGRVVLCPCPDTQGGHHNIAEFSDLNDPSLWEKSSGIVQTTVNEQVGYFRWEVLEDLELIVGTFAPLSDFIDYGALNLQLLASVLILSMVIFYLFFILQRQHIIEPIRQLGDDIMAISPNNLAYRLPIHKGHAFTSLRETINVILEKSQDHFENITQQQKELSAAYAQLVAHEQQLQTQYEEIKEHEAHIQFLADHDPLTGLFNRRKFGENLQSCLDEGDSGAVFMVDIDDFKNINDTQGHVFGDKVLRFVAGFLKKYLGPNQTAYRFGGDEFLLLLEEEIEFKKLEEIFQNIASGLGETNVIDGRQIHLAVSAGVVCYPLHGKTVDELLIKVDLALHNAKTRGKSRLEFFEGSMAATFSERIEIENMLIAALEAENFMLLYQPVIMADTGRIAYYEALIRIKGQPMPAAAFIPIAEESNLILPIGRWVIKAAIKQLVEWQEKGKDVRPISINVSPKQFYDVYLEEFIRTQLEANKIDPALIEIEITETVFIDNIEEAIEIIERLRNLGLTITLDDFGTGYSSMNYITRIPVDRIKLDRRITEKQVENPTVMEGLISIAHGLAMDVVGEGVEKAEEALFLREVGCDYLQGYFFSVPIPSEKIDEITDINYSELLGW